MYQTRLTQVIKRVPKLLQDNTLTKKASLNAVASTLDYMARIVVAFLVTPIMVAGLGDYFYGVWQILMRLVGYISPASGRPTQALKFSLARIQDSTDYELKRSYVGSTLVVLALFLPIMVILGGVLSWFVPFWIKAPAEFVWNVRIASGVLVLNLIATTLVSVPHAVLEGENKGYKRMGLSTLIVFLGGGLTWLALYFNTGIVGVAAAAVLVSTIQLLFFLQVARSNSPWLGIAKPAGGFVREFLGLSWWFVAWNLIMNLMLASDVVVLGLLDSVELVSDYTLSKYAPETVITLVAMVVFGVLPGLGGIIGSGDLERAAKVRSEIMTFTWLVGTVFGTGILLWNRTFITLWVGASHFVGGIPDLLIVLVVFQFVLIRNDANVIDLTLRLNRKVILGGISVILSITSACLLVYFFKMGIVGVSIGIILGRLILSVAYPILIGNTLAIKLVSQIKAVVRPAIITILLFITATTLEIMLPTQNWHSLDKWVLFIIFAGLTAVVVSVIAFLFGLNSESKKMVLRRVRAIIHVSGN